MCPSAARFPVVAREEPPMGRHTGFSSPKAVEK